MDDKDRLGEKLHDKGKAAEDLFIAEQERLRLERVRKAEAAAGHGICPRDGAALHTHKQHGVTVDVCPTCHGTWLDKGELEAILKHEDEPGITRWVRSLFGR